MTGGRDNGYRGGLGLAQKSASRKGDSTKKAGGAMDHREGSLGEPFKGKGGKKKKLQKRDTFIGKKRRRGNLCHKAKSSKEQRQELLWIKNSCSSLTVKG